MPTLGTSKQVMLPGLTVPWEDQIDEAYEKKSAKYQELVEECQLDGLHRRCEHIEVGCRVFRAYDTLTAKGHQGGHKGSRSDCGSGQEIIVDGGAA